MKLSQATCAVLLMLTVGANASQPKLVGPLQDQDAIQGCAWSASAPGLGEGFVFLGEIDDSVNLMNIGGKDVALSLKSSTGDLSKLGDTQKRTFTAPGISVVATFKVNWACPEDSESCEVTRFKAVFDVTAGKKYQRVVGTGDVGC